MPSNFQHWERAASLHSPIGETPASSSYSENNSIPFHSFTLWYFCL